jgi:hypothetical protein
VPKRFQPKPNGSETSDELPGRDQERKVVREVVGDGDRHEAQHERARHAADVWRAAEPRHRPGREQVRADKGEREGEQSERCDELVLGKAELGELEKQARALKLGRGALIERSLQETVEGDGREHEEHEHHE